MKRFLAVAFSCLFACVAFSQEKMTFLDGNTYFAISFTLTTYVSYGDDRLFPDRDIDVAIAKKDDGGVLQITIELKPDKDLCDYFHKCGISGDISIEIASGDTIVCKEQNMTAFHDGMVLAEYYLTANDMELLRKNNIEILQFYMQTFSTKGNYLAANFHHEKSDTADEFTHRKERITITKVQKLVRKLK